MAQREIIVLVLSMLVLVAICEGLNEFDYLQVVIQWQPATCSDYNKPACFQAPGNRFSIHGVWPSLYDGYPTQCSGSPFDRNQISGLQPGISEIWPNVATGDNFWLWQHEWDKHGTCSESTFYDQQEYFGFGMDAYIHNNLQVILSNNQITPNGRTYTRDQVYAAIRAKTGKTPAVRCNYNSRTGASQLHEISLCFKKDASVFEDCPLNANKCGASFVWNSWNTVKAISEE
ncbi:ribonuclease MC-like [Momordica charantia]|uniref:Ribonuclease MC-like n=1 Tax=Momordica charantia TaxID=3673 RepID=A0A6J1D7Q5_MOMCH|nr:ribonuclease MC-like [Momordica charantia]